MKPFTPIGTLYFKNGVSQPIVSYMDGLGRFNIIYFATEYSVYACRYFNEEGKKFCKFYRLETGMDDSLRAEEIFNIDKIELGFGEHIT